MNDEIIDFSDTNGYAQIVRLWQKGDKIELTFGIDVKVSSLPDEPNAVAFTYGPLVLSAGLGVHDLEESTTGIMVRIFHRIEKCKDYIVITKDRVDQWKENISKNLIKEDGKLVFHLKGTDEDNHLFFTPHYRQHKEPYGIYWQLVAPHSKKLEEYLKIKKRNDLISENEIDSVQPGNDQYELSHHILGELTESTDHDGYYYRYAKANGWFEYQMKLSNEEETYLQFSYMPGNCKDSFSLYLNGTLFSTEEINKQSWRELIEKTYFISEEFSKSSTIVVRFQATPLDCTGRIISLRTLKKHAFLTVSTRNFI